MKTGVSLLTCFALFIFNHTTGVNYGYGVWSCLYSGEDGSDVVFIFKLYYNKQLFLSFNSTEWKFIGYTDEAKLVDTFIQKYYKSVFEDIERHIQECSTQMASKGLKYLPLSVQEPQVRVFSTKAGSSHQPGMLVCSAYSFYPKALTLTWLRNGEEVTSGVTFTDEMSNGNWLYQKHSYLEYTPTAADQISCMVEHASLSTPQLYPLENFPESRRNKLIVGTAGLLLGLAFLIAGVIYYKKHTEGHVLVPQY
ncbi:class II histocompatibility antigen, B-L beta chain-like [Boleophthalmus pectinirostris]|uniref:class II histocompatibility antigen, B-L beta chain-like n=1 Tax=Boleophthalmus pectinirostris TaxID=150288 RepID=UPI00242FD49B|nr:class II histocompatibility antigen, B-L beta chain-like [Boleophthalmus pectinirostris]